jgi:hypothetical protein
MSLRTLTQAGPTRANELFAKLSDTSDGGVETREKLFTELKAELELHTGLEEHHLFPILRSNAETEEIVANAIRDNQELQAKLAELESLPKNDEAFPERLKALQNTFRQHARDEKHELLPAVQRALGEEQVQSIAEKIEAGGVEAEQAKHDEAEQAKHDTVGTRRAKARQEREEAARHAAQQEAAEQAQKAAAEQARHEEGEQRHAEARQEYEQAERQADQDAAAKRAQDEARDRAREISETAARTARTAQTRVLRTAEDAADAVQAMTPDLRAAGAAPGVAVGAVTEIHSAWMDWMGQTTRAGAQMSQDLLRQTAEQQQRLVANALQGWMEHNASVMRITVHMAQASLRPFTDRFAAGPKDGGGG